MLLDAVGGDAFGCRVDIDGGRAVVGTLCKDTPFADAGAAYFLHGLQEVSDCRCMVGR